ncbi:hypothetical protein HYC85_002437 [Camellia sinensis]|uniref:non-specific serine/threonine protein kinase n=1 Tax=Camellia sinensis TaxID=4442 RepID=A0A7J7IAJ1_CAMSI|nr:hypothetical protein HYC85_002437 [Camellia sinensis]
MASVNLQQKEKALAVALPPGGTLTIKSQSLLFTLEFLSLIRLSRILISSEITSASPRSRGYKLDSLYVLLAPFLLMKQVCHRDLKLENTLLDGSPAPRLKICDFGYSKVLLGRITIPEIRNHEWFLKNLPADLMDEKTMSNQYEEPDQPMQSIDAIMQIISEATILPVGLYDLDLDMDDDMEDLDSDPDLDIDSSGEVIYAV